MALAMTSQVTPSRTSIPIIALRPRSPNAGSRKVVAAKIVAAPSASPPRTTKVSLKFFALYFSILETGRL